MLSDFSYRELINHLARFNAGVIRSKEFPRYVIIYQPVKKELDVCCDICSDSNPLNEMDLHTSATISWEDGERVKMTVHYMLSLFSDRPTIVIEDMDSPIMFPKGDIWMHRILHSFMNI